MSNENLKITILFGSYRIERNGLRVIKYLDSHLKERGVSTTIVDAKLEKLPLLERKYSEYAADKNLNSDDKALFERLKNISEIFKASDGFLLVAGEYNFSVQPGLKNLIDYFLPEYSFRPGALAMYSMGAFGASRGITNLRGIMGEVGMSSLPSVHYFPQVHVSLDENGKDVENRYEKQTKKFLDELIWYAKALRRARSEGIPN